MGPDEEFIVGIDADLRVHESRMGAFGSVLDPQPNNVDQRHLEELCNSNDPMAVNTFEEHWDAQCGVGTWHLLTKANQLVRCDYVLTRRDARITSGSCRTLPEFKHGTGTKDHVPLVLQMTVTSRQRNAITRRRQPMYDRHTAAAVAKSSDPADDAKKSQVRDAIAAIPMCSFGAEGTSHVHFTDRKVLDVLVDAFPLQPSAPKESWISKRTKAIYKERNTVWTRMSNTGTMIMRAAMYFSFKFWASQLKTEKWFGRLKQLFYVPRYFPCSGLFPK